MNINEKKYPAPIYDNTKKATLDQHRILPQQPKSRYDRNSDEDVTISNANESDDDTQPTQPGIITDIRPSPRKSKKNTRC